MAKSAITVSGVWRELTGAFETVGGVWREVPDIPVTVGSVHREGFVAFNPHIANTFVSTSSQNEQTGWIVDANTLQTARNKGYGAILCDNIEVITGSLIWYVEVTNNDDTTSINSLVGISQRYISISGIKYARLVYFSNDGNLAEGIGDFDFVQ